jgi:hypothetical protein
MVLMEMLLEIGVLCRNASSNIVTFDEQQTALVSSPSTTLVDNKQMHSTTSLWIKQLPMISLQSQESRAKSCQRSKNEKQ